MTKHDQYLENLVNNLDQIDEDLLLFEWVMKDGIWLKQKRHARRKMPDIIGKRNDGSYLIAELKGCWKKQQQAKKQIHSGITFVQSVEPFCFENIPYITRKIVVYKPGGYEYKCI